MSGSMDFGPDRRKNVVLVYDVATQRAVASRLGGVVGHISFPRLLEQLRAAGEFKPEESVTQIEVTDSGINFYLKIETNR